MNTRDNISTNNFIDKFSNLDINSSNNNHISNKGTGAGGKNTNINGLSYEEITDLSDNYKIVKNNKNFNEIKFDNYEKIFISASKYLLFKYMEMKNKLNKNIFPAAGCKRPDEVYIDELNKNIYIIEKKYQQGGGSADEKLQTGVFKKNHFFELFTDYKINYYYCLSDWFKKDEYKSVLKYNEDNNIKIFWGNDPDYKSKIISSICI